VSPRREAYLVPREEAERVTRIERDIARTDEFIQRFAKETVEWVKSVQALVSTLRLWARGFGRVIGLGPVGLYVTSEAFLVVVDKQRTTLH